MIILEVFLNVDHTVCTYQACGQAQALSSGIIKLKLVLDKVMYHRITSRKRWNSEQNPHILIPTLLFKYITS